MRQKRMQWLVAVINKLHFTIGAEVGTATGLTTSHILENCPALKRLFVADDWHPVVLPGHPSYYEGHPWSLNNMEEVFKQKVGNDQRVMILRGLSWEMAKFVHDESLDFAFIDASHDYESVVKDIKAWLPKIKPKGMICGHDINSPGVKQAAVEIFGNIQLKHAGIDQVWYVKI